MLKGECIDCGILFDKGEEFEDGFCLFSTSGMGYKFLGFDTAGIGNKNIDNLGYWGEPTSQKIIDGKIVYVRE